MKREREKTIRLAIVAIAIVTIACCYITAKFPEAKKDTTSVEYAVEEVVTQEEDNNAPVLGCILLIGLVAFEVGTFRWILKKEKQGYKFSET